MTKYTFLTVLFSLLVGNTICNNNQLHAQVPTPLFDEKKSLNNFSTVSNTDVFAIDLDNDNFVDILSASYDGNKIAWYKNNGTGNFGEEQIITTNADIIKGVYATDLDNDGSNDILFVSEDNNKIVWLKNNGTGNFGTEQIININATYVKHIYVADLDNNGSNDILVVYEDKIVWYANDSACNFEEQQIITTGTNYPGYIYVADLNNDGNNDLLFSYAVNNQIVWHKNNGAGNFGEQQIITTNNAIGNAIGANFIYVADFDNDGDNDVLSASWVDKKITWYKNDGVGNFNVEQIIATNANGMRSAFATDLDNDEDNDVLIIYIDKIAWYKNDGNGNFGEQQIITTITNWITSTYTADLDNDGDNDILSAFVENEIIWYANDSLGNFVTKQTITQPLPLSQVLATADIDNNNFNDVISTGFYPNQIMWIKNNGNDVFNKISFFVNDTSNIKLIAVGDIDTDGDIDIVYSSNRFTNYEANNDYLFWAENDGTGDFFAIHYIYSSWHINAITVVDIDNNGNNDIVIESANNNINYLLNNGAGNFSPNQIETNSTNYLSNLYITDIDNDGNKDILFNNSYNNTIAYYKNNGNGTFNNNQHLVANNVSVNSICAADVNNDSYVDILYINDSTLAWIPNNGDGTFANPQTISNNVAVGVKVIAADVDNDGDNDVLVASNVSYVSVLTTANKIAWYANNGNGTFAPEEIITTNVNGTNSIATADFDNDGDLDLASTSYYDNKVAWYKNLKQPISNNPTNPTFTLFPNPANNQVTLYFIEPIAANTKILLTDLSGKTVTIYNNPANSQSITINRHNLPKGLYFVQVQDANSNQVLGVSKVVFE